MVVTQKNTQKCTISSELTEPFTNKKKVVVDKAKILKDKGLLGLTEIMLGLL